MLLLRLILLLTVVPLVELVILLRLAAWTSWQATLLLVIVTGVVGAWLARREGLKAVGRIRAELGRGRMPADAVIDGLLILAAGIVLVTPGVLTDLCGFALLVPGFRRTLRRRVGIWIRRHFEVVEFTPARHVKDVEARVVDVAPDRDGR